MGQSPALMVWRSEFISEPQSHHEWIDVHVSIHCCAQRRGEIHSHIRIYPDLLDVCVDSPATWLAIKIVIYARLKRETDTGVVIYAVCDRAFILVEEEGRIDAGTDWLSFTKWYCTVRVGGSSVTSPRSIVALSSAPGTVTPVAFTSCGVTPRISSAAIFFVKK